MRTSVYDSAPGWFGRTPTEVSNSAAGYEYREIVMSASNERASARATVLAGILLVCLAGLTVVGAVALIGSVGFGLWELLS